MRIAIHHRTQYVYDSPARSVIQLLRLFPRSHESQVVHDWHLEVDHDAALRMGEDAFGNVTHVMSLSGPAESVTLTLDGEVETTDTQGVVRGTVERFPPRLYLRETALTTATEELVHFAAVATRGAIGALNRLHALMAAVHADIAFDTATTSVATTAAEAFALKRGVCQDLSHIFIAAARSVDIPARYVGGHLYRADGAVQQEAGHAWVEAYADDLGWVSFDPANGICTTDAHVRVSMGLDYLGAAPVRGTRVGGEAERLNVDVRVSQASFQTQG
jgi:transglutaminase-like putative cysteine protease